MSANAPVYQPQVVSWNLTQGCNLRCPHCYLAAGKPAADELTTQEGLRLIDQLAEAGTQLLILTGGEPLLRRDLFELATYAARRELLVVLGSNGTLINERIAKKLKDSGVSGVALSVDSMDPEKHDEFRGLKGSWAQTVRGIKACIVAGLQVAVQTTALRMNIDEIPELISFAAGLGAWSFNLYFLVCVGRGEKMTDLSPQQYESLLKNLLEFQEQYPQMMIRAKCAPHVKRLAYQHLNGHQQNGSSENSGAAGLLTSAGCPAGTSYLRVTPQGEVSPCPFLPFELGSVRQRPLQEIWAHSEMLQKLRTLELQGRCGACEFKKLCVGCRARAFALSGNLLDEDPWCTYQPDVRGARPCAPTTAPTWSPEAQVRIEKIPSFVRERVRQGAEAYAGARGLQQITPEVLSELRSGFLGRKASSSSAKEKDNEHV